MGTQKGLFATAAGIVLTSVSVWTTSGELSVAVDQQGQPSKQPEPQNPSPRPSNPTPRPSNPLPKQDTPRPPTDQPPRPGDRDDRDGDRNNDGRRDALDDTRDDTRDERRGERNLRAFAFQSPDVEGRFNIATRRLVMMEQRMQRSQEDLLKRLGEARQLSGERQTNALFDVIQQMMKDNAELQRYLVQSRTMWTGDVDLGEDSPADDGEARVPDDERRER